MLSKRPVGGKLPSSRNGIGREVGKEEEREDSQLRRCYGARDAWLKRFARCFLRRNMESLLRLLPRSLPDWD